MDKYKRDHSVIKLLQIASAISFILSVVFIILLILSRNSDIQLWYSRYLEYLASAEYKVEHMSEKFSVFLIVIFLYAFKAVFPIYLYPVSALCAVTSAVFPPYFSIPINLLGLSVLYSIKYFWGTRTFSKKAKQCVISLNVTAGETLGFWLCSGSFPGFR